MGHSLWGWVVDKVNALLNVALEILVASFQELLLLVIGLADNVDGLLSTARLFEVSITEQNEWSAMTYAELNWYGEEVVTGGLCNRVTALDTWKVDKARLDNTLLALDSLDDLLGETV